MTRALLLVFLAFAFAGEATAQARRGAPPKKPDPMTFQLVARNPDAPPEAQNRWVTAKGQIMPDTPKVFEAFVKTNDIAGLTIYFDSSGGSIQGGIQLGEALRRLNARVSIGRSSEVKPGNGTTLPQHQLAPNLGQCHSSCAYAFLGGRTRTVPIGAQFGVHMFWPGDKIEGIYDRTYSYEEIERAQRVSAQIAAYIQRMGIDMRLLDLASRTPPKGLIRRLTPRELTEMRIAAIVTGAPIFGQPQGWGILTYADSAALTTGGIHRDPSGLEIRYVLNLSCGPEPGFDRVQFEASLTRPPPTGKALALSRLLLSAGPESGVATFAHKDIKAYPDPFNPLVTINANNWLTKAGILPAAVAKRAAMVPADRLTLRLDNATSAGETVTITLPGDGFAAQHTAWVRACEKFRAEKPTPPVLDY